VSAPEARASSVDELIDEGIWLRRAGDDVAALRSFQAAAALDSTSTRARAHLAATHQAFVGSARGHGLVFKRTSAPAGYPVRRSLNVAGGDALRETVRLEPMNASSVTTLASPPLVPRAPAARDDASFDSPRWLSWTLTGLAGGAALVSSLAPIERYRQAALWNGNDCLQPGLTRGDVCRDSLEAGRAAERVGYWSLGASLLFGAGAEGDGLGAALEARPTGLVPDWCLARSPAAEAPIPSRTPLRCKTW
jgi:hypothetical protein